MNNEKYISALNFDWLSSYYDSIVASTTGENDFKNALVVQSGIEQNHRVLDLGCGTGTLAIMIKESHPTAKVTGIDGDPKILEIAREKSIFAQTEIRFDQGLSYELPYENNSFDRVTSTLFFHHLTRENKLSTLVEVFRVLKPDGEFHIADWGFPANLLMKIFIDLCSDARWV